jgi:hypothetical protein
MKTSTTNQVQVAFLYLAQPPQIQLTHDTLTHNEHPTCPILNYTIVPRTKHKKTGQTESLPVIEGAKAQQAKRAKLFGSALALN